MSTLKKTMTAPDGTTWIVDVEAPGSSNAMIVFRHPDGRTSRLDRYNWVITNGPESRSVTATLTPDLVLEGLNDAAIQRLYARSMSVSRPDSLAQLG